ncbi:cytochrome P450 [Janthinobacterium sp. 17J80-10]|uniref:cytochrome P450 n=1 Tax=Janthinobacterium sp. 17J80-10 TaxID=2497863 RepID=UPI0010059B28|nr:cytochrome P450 [Janthinobacterium sp. 17J80-10]QAU33574.1 cytochrome P450 [Janthinobacterium sp. 17J80-10]
MSRFCPVYPKPHKARSGALRLFSSLRRSWLDGLVERNYQMQMAEVKFPGLDLYIVNDPKLVREAMVDEYANFPKTDLLGKLLDPLIGPSIFTTNGRQWQIQREMVGTGFSHMRLKTAFPLMMAAVDAMEARVAALPDGIVTDIDQEMTHVTADIIFRTILSLSMESEDARKIFHNFNIFQKMAPRQITPIMFGLPRWLSPWLDIYRSNRAAREIRSLLEKFIRPRFDAHRAGNPGEHQDILSALLGAKNPDTGDGFAFSELVDQVGMLFLAGHETSASALAWSLYLISMSPEIQERMHAELSAVVGDGDIEYGHVKDLELTWNVFRESLRLYPPVGFFVRQAKVGRTMRGKNVAKDAIIVIAPWLIQRHRDLWERPDEFDPDRFASDSAKESLKCAYLPFGMGPRVCIGASFALQEAALILATLVRRFRFAAPPDGQAPQPVGRLTIRSENGVRVTIHKRTAT